MHYIEMYGVVYNDPPSNTPMYWTFSVGIGATTSDTLELTHSNLDQLGGNRRLPGPVPKQGVLLDEA